MQTRYKNRAKIFDIVITAVGGTLSVGVMLYGVFHFGLGEAWPELVLNLFYIACLAMIWMYFFNRLDHCRTLQLRHLFGARQRVHQLHADGNLDPPHHHLRPRGLFRDGSRKKLKNKK